MSLSLVKNYINFPESLGLNNIVTDVDPNATDALLSEPGARDYDGVNQYHAATGGPAALQVGSESFWALAWIYPDVLANGGIVGDFAGGTERWLMQHGTSTYGFWHTLSGTGRPSASCGSAGEWKLVLCEYDHSAETASIWIKSGTVDNEDVNDVSADVRAGSSAGNIEVAAYSGANFVNGKIGLVAMGKAHTMSWANMKTLFWNGGIELQYSELTAQNKTDIGLIEWWPGNENAGDRLGAHDGNDLTDNNTVTSAVGQRSDKIADESGNNDHGIINGANAGDVVSRVVPSGASGSYSMECDGSTNYLSGVSSGSSPRAVSVHVYHDNPHKNYSRIYSFNANTLSIYVGSGGSGVAYYNNQAINFTAPTAATWWHCVLQQEAADGKVHLYIDNVDTGTPVTATAMSTDEAGRIGDYSAGGQIWDGLFHDLRVFDDELTSDEREYLGNFGSSGSDPGTANLIRHWLGSNASFPIGATTDGAPLIRVKDQKTNSTGNDDWEQQTLANRPTYKPSAINSKKGLDFGASSFMDRNTELNFTRHYMIAALNLASNITAATSAKPIIDNNAAGSSSDAAGQVALGASTSSLTNERMATICDNGTNIYGGGETSSDITSGGRVIDSMIQNTTTYMKLDGVDQSLSAASGGAVDETDANKRFNQIQRIGADATSGNFLDDDIIRMVICDETPKRHERYIANQYLRSYIGQI